MIYFAKITKESQRSFFVDFPELEGCFTEGKSLKDALTNAKEALDGWLASNCDRHLQIPVSKKRKAQSYYPIEVDIRISFAVMLRKVRTQKGLSQAAVAKTLGITQQAYAKLEAPLKTNPSLSTIQKLSEALGVDIVLDLAA
jgi:predicted RNase H-like HicB family nuclease